MIRIVGGVPNSNELIDLNYYERWAKLFLVPVYAAWVNSSTNRQSKGVKVRATPNRKGMIMGLYNFEISLSSVGWYSTIDKIIAINNKIGKSNREFGLSI